MTTHSPHTGFNGSRCIARGDLRSVVLAVKRSIDSGSDGPQLIFSDQTGRVVETDLRGTEHEVLARLEAVAAASSVRDSIEPVPAPRGRGRPKLGVIGREVTLLPRHWDWLASQSGGASVALRRLVDEARRESGPRDDQRRSQASAYQFSLVLAGNLAGFEESMRALFAGDAARYREHSTEWPVDIRDHAFRLAFGSDRDAP